MSDSEHRHVSKTGEARRLEIFTGAGRRRRWSAEAKAEIVAESYADGMTVSGVARRHGLTVQQLFTWRRQLRRAVTESGLPGFVPVAADQAMIGSGDTSSVVIEMAGAVVRVPAGAAPATVVTVLQALRSLR
jgi:transposase